MARDLRSPGSQASPEALSDLRPAGVDPSRDYGIPNEAPDDAMEIVSLIEDAMLLAYAPNGDAHFTWRGGQDIGLIIDRVMDDAFTKGFYAGIGRKAPAQGTEAGTAETERLGPKDDGPMAESHAPSDLLSRLTTAEASRDAALARVGRLEDLAEGAVFHFFCCGAGIHQEDECGQLIPAMADLAKAIDFYNDPATAEEIDAVPASSASAALSDPTRPESKNDPAEGAEG